MMNMIAHELRVKFKAMNFMYCCCYGTQFHLIRFGINVLRGSFRLSLTLSINIWSLDHRRLYLPLVPYINMDLISYSNFPVCSFNILLMVSMGARETENSFYQQLSLCLSVNLGNLTVLFFSLYL